MHTQRRIRFNADCLTRYRKENDLTQKQLADLLDTKLNVVSYWETGKRTPLPQTVDHIVQVTGLTHADLYSINDETFGTKLTTLRLSQNIGQAEMARLIGTSTENLNRWEADRHVPSAYFVYCMAKVLGVTVEEFVSDSNGQLLLHPPHMQ